MERFNQIQTLDKEKYIKFFQSIGDPQITEKGKLEITQEKQTHKVSLLLTWTTNIFRRNILKDMKMMEFLDMKPRLIMDFPPFAKLFPNTLQHMIL